ncbi:hypothetical protein LS684_07090 [Cytobacillus spongiae]|uniref:hypothetical protein n=1 Tax=Cytobacillus spongiae TaxID=2901381 RepID=UPI001F46EFB3|nr:hypothetical protein [Cytobacillus spongiae]UII57200.1 hypothetical protein LS684_07090 [Cytobacillus spongiae]
MSWMRILSVLYYLMSELIIGALLFSSFYLFNKQSPPIFFFFLVSFLTIVSFTLLLEIFNEKGKIFFLFMIVPLIMFISWFIQFPLIVTLLIVAFAFWRTLIYFNDWNQEISGKALLFTVLIVIFHVFLGGIAQYPNWELVLYLLIAQIGFSLVGNFLIRLLRLEVEIKEKKIFFKQYLIVIIGMILTGLFLSLSMNFLKWVFFSLLKLAAWLSGLIFSPFFKWAEKQNWSDRLEGFEQNGQSEYNKAENEVLQTNDPVQIVNLELILILVFIASIVGIIYYLFNKQKVNNQLSNTQLENINRMEKEELRKVNQFPFLKRTSVTPPSHIVRSGVYDLERYGRKLQVGRNHSETLQEWLKRIGLEKYINIVEIYEHIRYGEDLLYEFNEMLFREQLNNLKNDLKLKQQQMIETGELTQQKRNIWKTSRQILNGWPKG